MSDIGRPVREIEIEEPSIIPERIEIERERETEIGIPEPVSPEILEPVEMPR